MKFGEPSRSLATAQELAAQGLQVLPARHRDKAPIVKWTNYQSERTERLLPQWFKSNELNFWVMTGHISGHIVVDCDSPAGDAWWRERLGNEVMDATAQVKTRNGTHYWFKIPADWREGIASWSVHPREQDDWHESFDVRADSTGVIVPPSVHESGHIYEWTRPLAEAQLAPATLLDGTHRAEAPSNTSDAGSTRRDAGGKTRSMLSSLLGKPPGGEGSGRNDWLARVAGHYAKTYHEQHDLYLAHVEAANNLMGTPLDEAEYTKTVESVWKGEHERNQHRALDADCGWLQSAGTRIMTQVVEQGQDDTRVYGLAEYANFDLQAKGVMLDEGQGRTYWVRVVQRQHGGQVKEIDAVIGGTVLGDDRALRKWLANLGCTMLPPENIWPRHGSPGTRMQRYLESQRPPEVVVSATLGWDQAIRDGEGGFITHEGVITATDVVSNEDAGVRPHPHLLTGGMAPHRYGFGGTREQAAEVLAEVMTFHHDDVTAMFGAWWAACLIKPQIEERTSLFPFMAVEAPSESGKTNGFFDLMTQLNGNTRGETQPTKAALRDMTAAHRNGIVWVDDLDDPAYLMELLRAATSGGTLTKMGEDRESVKNTKIVAPVVISGEALGLGTQKALLDRAIIVKATSPTSRVSLQDPARPQWDDVLALRERFPDGLSVVAGHLVQDALGVAPQVVALLRGLRQGQGRTGDKIAILRAGARLLDWLATHDAMAWEGEGTFARRVDAAVSNAPTYASNENSLTLEILPWALRTLNYPDGPYAGQNGDLDTAAYVEVAAGDPTLDDDDASGTTIWFSTALLAQAWEREKHGRVERRTQTEAAFKDQADAMGSRSVRKRIRNASARRLAYYRSISGPTAAVVLDRARGK